VGLDTDGGLSVLQFGDLRGDFLAASVEDRLPEAIAGEVDSFVEANTFVWGYAEDVVRLPPFESVSRVLNVKALPDEADDH